MVQDVAAVKDEGWLDHALVDARIVQSLELVPLCEDAQCMAALCRGVGISERLHLHRDKAGET